VTYIRALKALEKFTVEDADEQTGINIVRRALEEPLRMIVQNAGQEGSIVVEKVRGSKEASFGYNAATSEYGDLVSDGVIDPAKVTRTALQNAASIAGLMLTTEALVSELPEKKKAAMPMPPGGGDMDF
jgi:chaperonin GroEL